MPQFYQQQVGSEEPRSRESRRGRNQTPSAALIPAATTQATPPLYVRYTAAT